MLILARCIWPSLVGKTVAAALLLSAPTAEAEPSPTYQAALKSCRAAAVAASESVPTEFKCDWKKLQKDAPNGVPNGRFDAIQKGLDGSLTILDGGNEPTLVAIQTVHQASTHTCTACFSATRDAGGALAANPAEAPGCTIRIVRANQKTVSVLASGCDTYCGMRATFAGDYRRLPK